MSPDSVIETLVVLAGLGCGLLVGAVLWLLASLGFLKDQPRPNAPPRPFGMTLPQLLLRTGAMTGPFRRATPTTASRWARLRRVLRAALINLKKPKGIA